MNACLRDETPETLFVEGALASIGCQEIDCVIELAKKSVRHRARICAHQNADAIIQEMILTYTQQAYIRPHKQKDNIISYHIIEGEVDLYLFDNAGIVTKQVYMSGPSGRGAIFIRLPSDIYRTMVTKSPVVVFHEITQGPFKKENTIFAPWSPQEGEQKEITCFLQRLKSKEL